LVLGEVRHSQLGSAAFGSQSIQASPHCHPGNPMLEPDSRSFLVLFQFGKELQENLLRQIFLGGSNGQMTSDNADDERIERLHKRASRLLVVLSHFPQALP
jgi:hypothetical protein